MPNKSWTTVEIEILRKHYPENGTAFCADNLNKTKGSVKAKVSYLKLYRSNFRLNPNQIEFLIKNLHLSFKEIAESINEKASKVKNYVYSKNLKPATYKHFTKEEVKKIIELYPTMPNSKIGELIGRSNWSIKHKAKILGLKRTLKQAKKIQNDYSGPHRFKKGNLPANTLYDGAITTRNDKRGIPQKYIRISLSKWQYLSNYNWEKANGPKPKGFNIVFKDKNTLNCEIENLEMISNAELMQRNTIQQYPEELQQTMRALGKLNKTIKKYVNNN